MIWRVFIECSSNDFRRIRKQTIRRVEDEIYRQADARAADRSCFCLSRSDATSECGRRATRAYRCPECGELRAHTERMATENDERHDIQDARRQTGAARKRTQSRIYSGSERHRPRSPGADAWRSVDNPAGIRTARRWRQSVYDPQQPGGGELNNRA